MKKPTGGVSRRDVLDGSSLTKRFYDPAGWRSKLPPGWSPALVLSIGALAALTLSQGDHDAECVEGALKLFASLFTKARVERDFFLCVIMSERISSCICLSHRFLPLKPVL